MTTTEYTQTRTLTITLKDPTGTAVEGVQCYIRLAKGLAASKTMGMFRVGIGGDFAIIREVAAGATDVAGLLAVSLVPSVYLEAGISYVLYASDGTTSYVTRFSMPDEDARLEDVSLDTPSSTSSGTTPDTFVLTNNSIEPRHLDADSDAQKLAFRDRIGVTALTEITQSKVNALTQSLAPLSLNFSQLTVAPQTPMLSYSTPIGSRDSSLLLNYSNINDLKIYRITRQGTTVTPTELTVAGLPTDRVYIRYVSGAEVSGLIFCINRSPAVRVFRYLVTGDAVAIDELTVVGNHTTWVNPAVTATGFLGIVFGGGLDSGNDNTFTLFAVTGDTITFSPLTVASGSITARKASKIKGDDSAGIIVGGFVRGTDTSNTIVRYARTANNLVLTDLAETGENLLNSRNVRGITGSTTAGLIDYSDVFNYSVYYNITGNNVTTGQVELNNAPRLGSNIAVGEFSDATWLIGQRGILAAYSSRGAHDEAGIKNVDTIVASNIVAGDLIMITAVGVSRTLSYTFNVDDISQSADSPTALQAQYGGNAVLGYVDLAQGYLYLRRTSSYSAVNKIRVYRF